MSPTSKDGRWMERGSDFLSPRSVSFHARWRRCASLVAVACALNASGCSTVIGAAVGGAIKRPIRVAAERIDPRHTGREIVVVFRDRSQPDLACEFQEIDATGQRLIVFDWRVRREIRFSDIEAVVVDHRHNAAMGAAIGGGIDTLVTVISLVVAISSLAGGVYGGGR